MIKYINILINFAYEHTGNIQYLKLRLKDSEKILFAKDLLLEWTSLDQPERLNPEDHNEYNLDMVCDSLNTTNK